MSTSSRKIEHLNLCAEKDVESHPYVDTKSGFDDIFLIPTALPEINKDDINTEVTFLGKRLAFPLMISSMTGGHPDTTAVNRALAEAAQELGIGIGVGSQRAALEDPTQVESFRVVRDAAPDAFVYGNIGAAQLVEYNVDDIERAVDMIGADAMALHLNFLQEAVQPEGDTNACGCLAAIENLCRELSVPVIVKETGAGISRADAHALFNAGASAIDVGGVGGTSWAGVEVYRAKARGDRAHEHMGELFWNWGMPTALSVMESNVGIPVIATGGIRTGIDIAKSIAIGATVCATALPLVKPALSGTKDVVQAITAMTDELETAMFLTGCNNIAKLQDTPVVITGRTREILDARGIEHIPLARRDIIA